MIWRKIVGYLSIFLCQNLDRKSSKTKLISTFKKLNIFLRNHLDYASVQIVETDIKLLFLENLLERSSHIFQLH